MGKLTVLRAGEVNGRLLEPRASLDYDPRMTKQRRTRHLSCHPGSPSFDLSACP